MEEAEVAETALHGDERCGEGLHAGLGVDGVDHDGLEGWEGGPKLTVL